MSAILSQLESDLGPVSGLGRQRALSPRRGTFFWEATRIALDSIRAHKMRSVLTLLVIIIGVASVVIVGGAIEGLGYYVKDRLVSALGTNGFTVPLIARMTIPKEEGEKL